MLDNRKVLIELISTFVILFKYFVSQIFTDETVTVLLLIS